MARGNEAKEKLMNKIIQMPNVSFIGCYDKKYYRDYIHPLLLASPQMLYNAEHITYKNINYP